MLLVYALLLVLEESLKEARASVDDWLLAALCSEDQREEELLDEEVLVGSNEPNTCSIARVFSHFDIRWEAP